MLPSKKKMWILIAGSRQWHAEVKVDYTSFWLSCFVLNSSEECLIPIAIAYIWGMLFLIFFYSGYSQGIRAHGNTTRKVSTCYTAFKLEKFHQEKGNERERRHLTKKSISVIFFKIWLSLRRIPKGMGLYTQCVWEELQLACSFLSLKRIHLKEKSHIYVQCGKASFRAFISSSTRVLICENAYKCAEFTTPPSFSAGETIQVVTGTVFIWLRSHCVWENT